MKTTIIVLPLIFILFSCAPQDTFVHLSREDLFGVSIGKMEDQFDFFIEGNKPIPKQNTLLYDDGIFYLANGAGARLMEFTRFGELALLLYKNDENSIPVLLPQNVPAGKVRPDHPRPWPGAPLSAPTMMI